MIGVRRVAPVDARQSASADGETPAGHLLSHFPDLARVEAGVVSGARVRGHQCQEQVGEIPTTGGGGAGQRLHTNKHRLAPSPGPHRVLYTVHRPHRQEG